MFKSLNVPRLLLGSRTKLSTPFTGVSPLRSSRFVASASPLSQHATTITQERANFKDASGDGAIWVDSEPLLLSGDSGYGYFPARLGEGLSQDRYTIVRKLGWGEFSSVWLARDALSNRHVALKIYTVRATREHDVAPKTDTELAFLQRIVTPNSHPGRAFCLTMLDHFTVESVHGSHFVLALEPLGPPLNLILAKHTPLPISFIKEILRQMLTALDYLHSSCEIIHSDMKCDNILLVLPDIDQLVKTALSEDPSTTYPYREETGPEPTVVSQPIAPTDTFDGQGQFSIKLTDFGQCNWTSRHCYETCASPEMRAPEVILGHKWDSKVDIWALGCIAFQLLTNRLLFRPKAAPGQWEVEDDHLASMMELTWEKFSADMLSSSRFREKYFNADGRLLRVNADLKTSIESAIINYDTVDEREIPGATAFIKRCLQLRPGDRSPAAELLQDKWLQGT